MAIQIEKISKKDNKSILDIVRTFWGDETIIVHNEIFLVSELSGLKAVEEQNIIGVLHYRLQGEECEILTLASTEPGRGVGTALITNLEKMARKNRCRLISLITTNDNLNVLGFYQRHGFHLAALYPDQVTKSRLIKPSIPDIGDNNIPIRDELRLEKVLK
jgi:N-acetylglutamate synthase-like GNAT family acetyltransferase